VKFILVTGATMPKADPESHLLVAALAARGVEARVVPWDSDEDWAAVDLVMVRTPWDYFHRLDEFLAWADRVARATRLVNPAEVLRWNTHKRYLLELGDRGVPVVPTTFVARGTVPTDPAWLTSIAGELVVKPAVDIGAFGAMRAAADDPALFRHLRELAQKGDVLVQPFIPSVLTSGEISLAFAGGTFSHAVRKLPKAGDYRVQSHHGGRVLPHEPSQEELRLAQAALAAAPAACAYARIDLIATAEGPRLMEMELVEPELFLPLYPESAGRFADALVAGATSRT
jgi:glutathione synthase/RimK-type ligase-like ATP-grasp enzyme